ncbi:hypothetical protein [Kutzneria buriramensis]|uniref:Uncharacterized protein n=1 Tax=Kutzneria buriramensis TaxID=1045776 RepID=A0A3E0GZ73_9PSEU|nr:hypothetical protein [Kutzneria buriramensis]REH33107.1 hypothetical protein BCF44_120179 [Kutzneria buriramensis]
MSSEEPSELDYLREIERRVRRVVDAAYDEGWLSYEAESDASKLQRAVNLLARAVRHDHFTGDGCWEEGRPLIRLAGARIVRPEQDDYEQECDRLGVEPRPEGWALWRTWGLGGKVPVTLVVTAVDTTEGLLRNWSRGVASNPLEPLPSQIAQVHEDWLPGVVYSPAQVRRLGGLGT